MLPVLEAATNPALQQSRADYFRTMELIIGNPIGNRLLMDKNPSLNYLIPGIHPHFSRNQILNRLA